MNIYPQNAINTDRLCIRPYQENDLPLVYGIHCVKRVNQYLPYNTWRSQHDALDWHDAVLERRKNQQAEQYVILKKGTLIGTCLAFNYQELSKECGFGYVLGDKYWQQGLMSEAMAEFVPALADHLKLVKLNATVESDNIASIKLLEKLKFKLGSTEAEKDILLHHYSLEIL